MEITCQHRLATLYRISNFQYMPRVVITLRISTCWLSTKIVSGGKCGKSVRLFSVLQTANSHTVRLSFNTPDSRVDRELTTEFILRRPERQIQLNIKTPWKKINIDGSCVNNEDLKKATLGMVLDDRQRYSISTELQVGDWRS